MQTPGWSVVPFGRGLCRDILGRDLPEAAIFGQNRKHVFRSTKFKALENEKKNRIHDELIFNNNKILFQFIL